MSWCDHSEEVLWRADEVELISAAPIQHGPLGDDIVLSDGWWAALNGSLDVLVGQRITRVATPDTEVMTQELVTREIERAFPDRLDATISEPWTPSSTHPIPASQR